MSKNIGEGTASLHTSLERCPSIHQQPSDRKSTERSWQEFDTSLDDDIEATNDKCSNTIRSPDIFVTFDDNLGCSPLLVFGKMLARWLSNCSLASKGLSRCPRQMACDSNCSGGGTARQVTRCCGPRAELHVICTEPIVPCPPSR